MSSLRTRKRVVWLAIILGCLAVSGVVVAQVSTNFDLSWHLLSGGGGSRESANYHVDDSLGQWVGGSTGSAGYDIDPGFWYGAAPEPAPCLVPLESVSISGPSTGYTNTVYVFAATFTPVSTTLPVNYTWSSDGLVGGQETDTASYSWMETGSKTVTLQASNCGGTDDDVRTIAIGAVTPEGDNYEEDDTCDVANTIATDGTPQTHTFHDGGDEDWIEFTALANKSYIVQTSNVGTDHDAVLFLYGSCDGASLGSEDNAFGQTLRLEWNNTTAGTYYLMLKQHDPAVYGEDTNYDVSVTVDTTPPSAPTNPRSAPLDESLAVQWKKPPEPDVVGYNVRYGIYPGVYGSAAQVTGKDTTYVELTGLENGLQYYVVIEAVDFSSNTSPRSLEISNIPAEPPDDTTPSVAVSQPTTGAVYTTSLASLTLSGSAQDVGGNLSRAKVHNLSNGHVGWDYGLAGSSDSWYVEDVVMQPGDNDLHVTVYDDAGNEDSDSLTIHRLAESLGGVIIVAGHNASYGLQTNIYNVTNNAYQVFQGAGFSDEDIYYLAPASQDPDSDGVNEVDGDATDANLQYAIETWAAGKVKDKVLHIYMMDHGVIEGFCTDGCTSSGQTTPQELDGWLSTLEDGANAPEEINVIIEACHSGSFIDRMALDDSLSKAGRVVIASTDRTHNAYASAQGAFFSDAFLSCVVGSGSLKTCFEQAESAVAATGRNQTPWMDDNGDGLANPSDGSIAQDRYIASSFGGFPPTIQEATVEVVGVSGTLEATVERGGAEIDMVWAAVFAPSFQEPTTTTLQLGVPLVLLEADPQVDGLYAATYPSGFVEEGTYRVVFYAQDEGGVHAAPRLEAVGEAVQIVGLSSDSSVELGQTMHFTATLQGPEPYTYTWDFGGAGTATGAGTRTPTYLYDAAGTYTVRLEAENPYGTDDKDLVVEVREPEQHRIYLPLVLRKANE